jgi:acyl dehydratase
MCAHVNGAAIYEEYAVNMNATNYKVGDSIPDWVMESVSAERMRTMAAVLRDPNPLHWDREAVNSLPVVDTLPYKLGKRTINQGPLGLSYIVNMLNEWMGPNCIKRFYITFPQVVLDEDRVVARGTITDLREENGVQLADCDTWLEHEDRGVLLKGRATVKLSS